MASCVELFAGAGGLTLGLKRSGFHHLRLVERERRGAPRIASNPAAEGDQRESALDHAAMEVGTD